MLTPEQLEIRKTGVGASEAAAVVGWSPWDGPIAIYNQKVGLAPPKEQNHYMEAGSFLESAIAEWYASKAGVKLQRVNHTLRHKKYPWILATPDRFVLGEGRKRDRIVEIKTVGSTSDDWGADGTDEIPRYYRAQVEQTMEVTGMESCDVAALFMHERRMRIFQVHRHEGLAQYLVDEVSDFWNEHVVKRVPPAFDASDDTKDYLKATFRDPSEQIIDAPNTATKYVEAYLDAKEKGAALKAQYEEAASALMFLIGNHAGMRGPWGTATWKMTKSNGTDWEAAVGYLLTELQNVGVDIPKEQLKKQFMQAGYRKLRVTKPRNR